MKEVVPNGYTNYQSLCKLSVKAKLPSYTTILKDLRDKPLSLLSAAQAWQSRHISFE